MAKRQITKDYKVFFAEIKEKIYQAQYEAMKQVNKALIKLYWEIGKSIVEKQQKHKWGKSVVEKLAEDLQNEFPGMNGLSSRNVWRMRMFYTEYEKLPPMVAEISWSHNIIIIEKCKDENARKFYIGMSKKYGWTKNVLVHHIEGKSFEKFLLGQTNFDKTLPEKYKHQAKLAVKDEYNFEFLEISDEHNERELELAIIKNIRKFLLEMGGDFAFIGNQYRLALEEDFCIDILLYHRRLKSLVAIDLKTGKFKPDYAGKMNFYLSAVDDILRHTGDRPSIGIIVCKSKNRLVAEYALRDLRKPIGISGYQLTEALPNDLKGKLPSIDELETELRKR